jgi:hypothetical protein
MRHRKKSSDDGKKHMGWVWTINGVRDTNYVLPEWEDLDTNIKCYVYQFERGRKSKRLHIQGYIQWKHGVTFNKCRSTLPRGTHIEPAYGTRDQCYAYCAKEDTREPGTGTCVFGEFATEQGKRNDLAAVTEKLVGGSALIDVALEHPNTYVKFHKGLEKLEAIVRKEERDLDWNDLPKMKWYWGTTGAYKTGRIYQRHGVDAVYKKSPKNKWWDGFEPNKHKVILIDEWPKYKSGGEPMDIYDLLQLGQPYPLQVEKKGGAVHIGKQQIYITSNYGPRDCFGHLDQVTYDALMRRLYVKLCEPVIKEEPVYENGHPLKNHWPAHLMTYDLTTEADAAMEDTQDIDVDN